MLLRILYGAGPQPHPSPTGWHAPFDPTPAYIATLWLFGLPMLLLLLLGWGQIMDWLDHRERLRRGRRPK